MVSTSTGSRLSLALLVALVAVVSGCSSVTRSPRSQDRSVMRERGTPIDSLVAARQDGELEQGGERRPRHRRRKGPLDSS
jgi:hypothetical protein